MTMIEAERAGESPPATIRGLTRLWRPRPGAWDSRRPLVERVMASRGLLDDVEGFLAPSLRGLHDPSLIPDMDRAAARLLAALDARERVVIYADYDVDGATAAAILYHMAMALRPGAAISTYVPHRLEEGYGLNDEAIRSIAASGATLIVSVDCGVTATGPARVARSLGVDLIITDHHNPPARMEEMPEAYAVVHPRRPDSAYPFGELSGAGVAYKLAWRMATLDCGGEKVSPQIRALLLEMLGLAALGAIADVVPLLGENRVIARYGLGRIRGSSIEGLAALVEASGLESERVDAEDVGFRLAPRLNACGRMGHARDTIELLTVAKGERARELARQLSKQNEERRAVERAIFEQAERLASEAGMDGPDRRAIVLASEGWHAGVVGIVCSRLVERFSRPALLLARDGDMCHGSGRSIPGFSLHAALCQCAEHMETFGGHDMAAGMRVRCDRWEGFVKAFTEIANGAIADDDLLKPLVFDAAVSVEELTARAVGELQSLAPFGAGNPPVRLLARGMRIVQEPAPFGTSGDHLSIVVDAGTGRTVRVVAWRWAKHRQEVGRHQRIDAVIEPKVNTWRGVSRVEPVLVDLRASDG